MPPQGSKEHDERRDDQLVSPLDAMIDRIAADEPPRDLVCRSVSGARGSIAVAMPRPVDGDDSVPFAEVVRDAGLKVQEAGAGAVNENDGRPGSSVRVV